MSGINFQSNSFGIVIAYIIPGLLFMHSLSFYSYKIEKVFDVFLTLKSNVGLFLLVLLFSIALGLMLQIVINFRRSRFSET